MKHILILGAGLMQKPAIESARELGCHITVVDANENAICVPLSDRFEKIDLKDIDSLKKLALEMKKTNGIDGVFTAGTDFSYAVSCIAAEVGLQAHTPQAALNASNKILMRTCFKNKVASPDFIELSLDTIKKNTQSAFQALKKDKKYFVVKPCDNMGGRGCRMIRSIEEFNPAIHEAIKYSRTKQAILEDYMDGKEYSIDALIFNGEITITGFADRHIFYPPYFIEMGHTIPTIVSESEKLDLLTAFVNGIKALGLTYGAAKADIKLTSKGPMIGEIAGRLSGGYMSGWTYPYASKLNVTKQAILLALGETPNELIKRRIPIEGMDDIFEVPCSLTSAERAWISIPGMATKIENISKAKTIPGVRDVFPRISAGDITSFPLNNVEKAGNVISCLKNRNDASKACNEARKCIFIRLSTHNKQTDAFLEQPLDTQFPPSAFPVSELMSLNEAKKSTMTDWNGLTIKESLSILPSLIKTKVPMKDKKFLHAFYRGGLQGAVYFCETNRTNAK
ncbi:MAG: hypothetical protein BKP49_09195 [Treponema sp. CETP13]|nr:MAG: hypothetical protein BKP49_09195 [Treponema sp. CETP13]